MFVSVKKHLKALDEKQLVIDKLRNDLNASHNRERVLSCFIRDQTPRDKIADYDPKLLSDQEFRNRYFPTPRNKKCPTKDQ